MHSLRIRLLLTLMCVVLVALGTVAWATSRTTTRAFQQYLARDLERNQRVFATLRTFLAQDASSRDVDALAQQMQQILGERFILTDEAGTVLADSNRTLIGQRVPADMQIEAAIFTVGQPPLLSGTAINQAPIAAAPLGAADLIIGVPESVTPFEAAPNSGTDQAAPVVFRRTQMPLRDPIEAAFIESVNRSLLLAVAVAGSAALLLTGALGRRILRPIETLTAAAQQVAAGDRTQRVPVRSHDEIGVLSCAFNAMADSLARQETLRRNLVTDVAHELRTPLTNIRGYLEAIRDGVADATPSLITSVHEEAMLLNRLIDDLQDLALAEAGQLRLHRQMIDLGAVVEQAARAMQPAAVVKGLTVDVSIAPDVPPITADAERIGQVLRNLLGNAITHTRRGGSIEVALAATTDEAVLSVSDTGRGIAPEHLAHIWDRFYRVDPARARATGGAGLGLAIVKQLVEAHGGTVDVASTIDRGTTFAVRLPLAAPPAAVLPAPE